MPVRSRLPALLPRSGHQAPTAILTPAARLSAWSFSFRPLPFSRRFTAPSQRRAVRSFSSGSGVQVTPTDRSVKIASSEATKRAELPNFWLRDNCRCSSCVNQDTSQRNFDTFKIPADVRALEVKADDKGLNVVWSGDNHKSHYPWDFITFYQNNNHRSPEAVDFHFWGSNVADRPPTVHFDAVMNTSSDEGIAQLTDLVRRYGFAFVEGTPFADPADTQRLLERIAFIRVTHYGGFYDFVPDLAMADTAYTNLPLPAHTDTTYFTDPAGLQAFHLLSHHGPEPAAGASLGGSSLLVDGFHAARLLREEHPEDFDVLTRVRLPWHASGNQGITLSPDRRYPVIEVLDEQDRETTGASPQNRIHRIRWNNDDRGIVPFGGPDADGIDPGRWYDAARTWQAILKRADVEYWTQLQPGTPLIFDNWRVMHGRSAFVGVRRMCGGYTARDDFISRWRNTNYPRDEVLKQVVG
ncbi:trimethyllysine dioxygenase [Sporothrix schenckii 1099-18]|uniref:Trimethyllysine dioxygenase n=1 Tax=Sporothrix schenckii 1099-18 TaxID=1397361 RepID=A0A0F2MC40_SPOSC|nr:trimethyllysine dioxygenase [Sporothrix schenckii 1099-18]KJR86634.1 trimethyllysine dioxygenase [Sporothrix schenckii 1099-18]